MIHLENKNTTFKQTPLQKTYFALGTRINLTIFGCENPVILDKTYDLIKYYEDILTVNRDESEVMSINHAAGKYPVRVSEATYKLIRRSVQVSQEYLGFNSLIGPLVKLWGIGFDNANVPEDKEIKSTLNLIDPQKITLNDNEMTVFLQDDGMELDLGGIAKGYIADRIKDFWHAFDISSGIIDLGGNLLLVGPQPKHDDALWRIGVQNPHDARGSAIGVVVTSECSIVTSGIYERHLEVDGKSYHHILDSKTGYPKQNNLASVTVFSKYSIDGEIETTNLFFAGEPVKDWGKDDPNLLGAVFVTTDNKIYLSKFTPNDFHLLSDEFEVIQH
ncbi:FAD:protein FMN transferase [Ligilactobacillus salivarius]|uniref:FAD:protein FMN transferase n=1 Tax=Ligilactobacillus salivarius TaxID=1624 RepID=UPI0021076F5D|nr:FAD:protein FMN transferase [Ligilactobacillus salivarius]UTX36479.1 FAD:protein FMN transferase [Ligilactobacillus salivarius]